MTNPDVLVVGGGPGGAAAGYWLARRGLDVLIVEKKEYPREKACGDGLTPRAVKELIDMGFDFDGHHRITGLRAYAGHTRLEMPWPEHSTFPSWGAVVRRSDLDMQVAALAEKQGAIVLTGTEAVPVVDTGELTEVILRRKGGEDERIKPKLVVIADGSLSRFGRKLGMSRRKDYPFGLAVRGYWESPNSDDSFLESQLDIRDKEGKSMPGYGWVFPLGDGEINIGVGAVSSFKGWKGLNTSRLLEAYVESLPDHWKLTDTSMTREPIGGKLPMAFSVGPRFGRNWVAVGDAIGAVNPFNGEGIDYAYETGRLVSDYVADTIATGNPAVLQGYSQALDDRYADYQRVARRFVMVIGQPAMMRSFTYMGMRSRPLMEWALKVMANLLEPEERGLSERLYGAIERIVKITPDPLIK
ncbi:MAG: geranylgeranyl reductase family protein [Actinomycetota bacterium]|nr:geranylgeranyl reductase family protein [Actinomycetota bacterium]